MPLSNEEEEVRLCYSNGCTNPGDFSNEYTDENYCEAHNEMVIDHYYESNDDDNDNDDDDDEERTIHNYSYKPRPSFMRSDGTHSAYVRYINPAIPGNVRSNSRTTLTMGFELETQYVGDNSFPSEVPRQLLDDVNSSSESDIYLKEDGSVYNGVVDCMFMWRSQRLLTRHTSSSSLRLCTRTGLRWFSCLVVRVMTTLVMT